MPNFVQQYRSTDTGAPVLTGQVGSLITLLDTILINGYSTIAITSVSRSGTTATAVIAANTTLVTGNWLVIAGFNETDYNGTKQITVNSSTSISWEVSGSPATPGTGSGTYKKAGLGWTKPYNTTNIGVYLPQSGLGFPQHYYRVSDNALSTGGAMEAVVCGSETMSDVNTGSAKFPTVAQQALTGTEAYGGHYWRKSASAGATARTWTAFGDGATFYLVMNSDASLAAGRYLNGFGAFHTFTAADAYNSFNGGCGTTNSGGATAVACALTSAAPVGAGVSSGLWLPRNYAQTGGSILAGQLGLFQQGGSGQVRAMGSALSVVTYPNPCDGALWVTPGFLYENGVSPHAIRGRLRGLYQPCHSIPINEYDTATNVAGLSGVTLTGVTVASGSGQGLALFDTFGPW